MADAYQSQASARSNRTDKVYPEVSSLGGWFSTRVLSKALVNTTDERIRLGLNQNTVARQSCFLAQGGVVKHFFSHMAGYDARGSLAAPGSKHPMLAAHIRLLVSRSLHTNSRQESRKMGWCAAES